MSAPGRGTFLAGLLTGLGISGFVVLLFAGIWFFTLAPHRETTMKLPYAAGHAVSAVAAPRVCPPGYYLGPKGRWCWPLGYGRSPPPGEGPYAEYVVATRQSRKPAAERECFSTTSEIPTSAKT